MKRNILTLATLCGLTILSSCNKESDLLLPETKTYTLGAVVTNETPSSKVSINADLEFNWTNSDALAIKNSDNSAAKFTINTGQSTNSATFNGTATDIDGYPASVVYPYNARTFNQDGSYTFNQPMVQNHTYNASGDMNMTELGKSAYMWGKSTENVSGSTIPSVEMNHLMSIIVVELDALKDKLLTKLTITSTFPKTATVDFVGGVVIPESGSYSTLDIKFKGDDGITVTTGNVARIAVLPHIVKSGSSWNFIVHYEDGGVKKYMTGTKTFNADVDLNAGQGRRTSLPALTEIANAVPSYAFTMADAGKNMLDPRDFKTYETVNIAKATGSVENYVWMNENLNVGTFTTTNTESGNFWKFDEIGIQKWMYNNAPLANVNLGGLYEWYEAISGGNIMTDTAQILPANRANWSNFGVKTIKVGNNTHIQGICPQGWHIPTKVAWDNTFGESKITVLKNFILTPYSGGRNPNGGGWSGLGDNSFWWTSTNFAAGTKRGKAAARKGDSTELAPTELTQSAGRSIRCVMNC